MTYAIPYILLIIFYGFMAWWNQSSLSEKARKMSVVLCFVVTLVFWGFRGFCFYDWMSYYPLFLQLDVSDTSFTNIFTRFEPGFSALMFLCKYIFDSYTFFMFVCMLINMLLLSRFFFKHIDNYPLGLMICTTIGGIFFFTDLMRNAISTLIFINAVDYIYKRKPIRYFSFCLLSICFHYSAVFFFPLYFFLHRKTSKVTFSVVFFIGCAIYVLNTPLLSDSVAFVLGLMNPDLEYKARFYLTELSSSSSNLNFVFFERVFTGILVICYMEKLRSMRKDANIFINCVLLFFVMTFYLHEFVTLSHRLSLLYACGYWVIWMDLIRCFTIENNRKLFIIFICFYCFLRILGHTKNVIANYDNVLFDSETFQQRQSIMNKNFHEQQTKKTKNK